MAEEVVNVAVGKLVILVAQLVKQQVSLVTGVEDDVERLNSSYVSIQAVLSDAKERQVTEEAVRIWLEKLKNISLEIVVVLEEWSTELRKIQTKQEDNAGGGNCCYFRSPCLYFRHLAQRQRFAIRIRRLIKKLEVINREKNDYSFPSANVVAHHEIQHHKTTSFVNKSMIFGRDEETRVLVSKLCQRCCSSQKSTTLEIVSIVATRGMGKTILAQLAYNDNDVVNHFEKRIWVCVSDPFDGVQVAKSIVELLEGDARAMNVLQTLLEFINAQLIIKGIKFMLVLDDVRTEDSKHLQPLLDALQGAVSGSKILMTTRNARVAESIGSTYMRALGALSETASWKLFFERALSKRTTTEANRENLEKVGRKIVERCQGLPLALYKIGSDLRLKDDEIEWEAVLDTLSNFSFITIELLRFAANNKEVLPLLS